MPVGKCCAVTLDQFFVKDHGLTLYKNCGKSYPVYTVNEIEQIFRMQYTVLSILKSSLIELFVKIQDII